MGSCNRRVAARSPSSFVCLAAAVAGLSVGQVAAAQTLVGQPPAKPKPRTDHIQSSYQTWLGFTALGPIVDPLRASVDLGGGFHEDMHPAAVFVRPALGVALPHGFSIFAGYTYSSFWNARHQRGEEHTPFQQVLFVAPFSAVEVATRLRWEERIRPGSDVAFRLRTLVAIEVPLGDRAPVRLVIWDEIFFGLNQPADWQPTVLDQDLFFAGFAWTPDKHFRADAGYMGAVAPRSEATSLSHCLSISTLVTW